VSEVVVRITREAGAPRRSLAHALARWWHIAIVGVTNVDSGVVVFM